MKLGHSLPPIGTDLNCTVFSREAVKCEDIAIPLVFAEDHLDSTQGLFWIYICGYVVVVLFAGFMSGLTLAILSLDVTTLKVMEKGGVEKDRKYASRIMPLVKRHHWVLVALVIANSLAVEAMPLILDKLANVYVAMSVSVTAVLLFGEVLPQAICSRYGLAIGYHLSWLVWGLVGLFFIVAWPVGKLSDLLLGKHHGTFYRKAELVALLDLHGPSSNAPGPDSKLTLDEVKIIKSALEMTSRKAIHLVRALDKVDMLKVDEVFDERTLRHILEIGRSRIPIYENSDPINIVRVVLTKKPILVDPKEKIPVQVAMERNLNHAFTKPYFVKEDTSVHDVLDVFQTHIAFVTQINPKTGQENVCGIITMEHIMEALLREDIWDETDRIRKSKRRTDRFSVLCEVAAEMGKDGAEECVIPKRQHSKKKIQSVGTDQPITAKETMGAGGAPKQENQPKLAHAKEMEKDWSREAKGEKVAESSGAAGGTSKRETSRRSARAKSVGKDTSGKAKVAESSIRNDQLKGDGSLRPSEHSIRKP